MKKLCFILLSFTLGLFLTQCGGVCGADKNAFIKNFAQFVGEKSDKSENDSRDRLFRQYVKECYALHEAQMGLNEKKDFWIGVLRYYYQRYGLNMLVELGKEKDLKEVLIKGLKEVGINLENINLADLIRLL